MKRVLRLMLSLAAVIVFCGLGALPLLAAEAAVNKGAQPIHVEADRMESYDKKNEVHFFGRVEAKQGDIVLHADTMRVTYVAADKAQAGKTDEQGRQVDKLYAQGNVKVVSDAGWVATGATMDYFAGQRKAILIGDAKVWQDNNLVTGNRIVLYLDEGKSIVERDPQAGRERVKAFLYPSGDKEEKNGK